MAICTLALLFGGFFLVRVQQEKRKAEAAEVKRGAVDKSRLAQMAPESEPVPVDGNAPRRSVVGDGKMVSYAPAPYTPPPPPPAPVRKAAPVKEKAPPPPPPVPKLVHSTAKAESKPFSYRFPRAFAPAGTMIPCYLSITVDSANFETPVVGKVEEPVYFNKRLIIPKGTEVHATARQGRLRDRIAITGTWRLVWSDGKELRVRGIALDRKYDPAKDSYGITDGSAGIRDQAGFHLRDGDARLPDRVRIIDLPPYSPELNPCEQARDMIRDETGNRTSKTITELRKATLPALQRFWNDAGAVLRLVGRPWLALQANASQPMQKSP